MEYLIQIEREVRIVQGLRSEVLAERALPRLATGEGVPVLVRAGISFGANQLSELGRFLDTDAAAEELERCCAELSSRPWTELFDFRPTFELVARHLFADLAAHLPQLAWVEFRDRRFGVTTRYTPTPKPS